MLIPLRADALRFIPLSHSLSQIACVFKTLIFVRVALHHLYNIDLSKCSPAVCLFFAVKFTIPQYIELVKQVL